jgi:hypothetical protein
LEKYISNDRDRQDDKSIVEKNNYELLDKGIDVFKSILSNNSSIIRAVCDTVREVSKSIEISINSKAQKEITIANERMKVMSETRDLVLQELNKEELSKEEREKLIGILEKATPSEEAVQAIARGTSVAKTALSVLGAVAVTLLVFKSKKRR